MIHRTRALQSIRYAGNAVKAELASELRIDDRNRILKTRITHRVFCVNLCLLAVLLAFCLAPCLASCSISINENQPEVTAEPPTATRLPSETSLPSITATSSITPTIDVPATVQVLNVLYEQSNLDLQAESALLMDAQTGQVFLEKNARQRMFPASTTKIMTALLALEYLDMEETLMVGEEVNQAWTKLRINAQKAGLEYGQEISVKDLLHGMLLMSGSDAAFVLAYQTAQRESGGMYMDVNQAITHFSELMNAMAQELGAFDTHFVNPDGFQDPEHYSTAYDLAMIARAAMQNRDFRSIVETPTYLSAELEFVNGTYPLRWDTTNRLLDVNDMHYYAPANGIKTGTTEEAGYCLVSSAVFDERLVIAVVLNSGVENVWTDSISLLEYARQNLLPGS